MKEVKFNQLRYPFFFLSGIFILISLTFIIFKGFNFGIDFTGGIVIEFNAKGKEIEAGEVRSILKNLKIQDYSVQKAENKEFIIKIGAKNKGEDYSGIVQTVKERVVSFFPKTDIEFTKIDFVSPQIGVELAWKALLSICIAFIAVLFYIAIRFELRYSVGGIIALIHDILLTFGFISIFSIPFDISTIAAILTVIGYSINDSVVVFDRIRENFTIMKEKSANIIQTSLNAMLARTIITSVTTLIAILAIIIIGGSILRPFALIVFFGIFVGTASSIFIAPMMLYGKKTKLEQ